MIEKLILLIKSFEDLQSKYSSFGAQDTEPDWQFQNALRNALEEGTKTIPRSANEWELFSSMDGVESVAAQFTEKAEEIVDLILNTPLKDVGAVKKVLENYCHRIDFK